MSREIVCSGVPTSFLCTEGNIGRAASARRALRRRNDKKHRITRERMHQLADQWLPIPKIVLPYPNERLHVNTQGKSPVR